MIQSCVQRRKLWLTPTTRMLCSNAAKMQNLLKLSGVPQTTGPISAASGPKCTILWGHVEDILLLNKFFFRLSIRALRYSLMKLCDGAQIRVRPIPCWRPIPDTIGRICTDTDTHTRNDISYSLGHT